MPTGSNRSDTPTLSMLCLLVDQKVVAINHSVNDSGLVAPYKRHRRALLPSTRFVSNCRICESRRAHGAQANVVAPNKHNSAYEAKYRGHLLESETYIGGKVEALESGVFRSDLPCRFKLQPEAYQVGSACRRFGHVSRKALAVMASLAPAR